MPIHMRDYEAALIISESPRQLIEGYLRASASTKLCLLEASLRPPSGSAPGPLALVLMSYARAERPFRHCSATAARQKRVEPHP